MMPPSSTRAHTKPGDKVSDGERDVGEVVNASDDELLAVVPLNKADQRLTVDGAALVNSPLPYLQQ